MKRNHYVLMIVLAGVAGAVLRGLSIVQGLEEGTGLPVSGSVPSLVLKLLCAAVLLAAVFLTRKIWKSGKDTSYEMAIGDIGNAARKINRVLGAALVGVGVCGLCRMPSMIAERTPDLDYAEISQGLGIPSIAAMAALWLLLVLSGSLLQSFTLRQDGRKGSKAQGMKVLAPMFWACLNLILTYHENSANPVMSDYAYELLLSVAIMAAFYAIACLFFSEPRIWLIALFAGLSVFLGITVVGGACIAGIVDLVKLGYTMLAPNANICRYIAYTVMCMYLLVELTQMKTTEET